MNKIQNIHFFGCSFTFVEDSPTGYEFKNFRKLIEEKLLCNSKNYSKSGLSNQHIFNTVYELSKDGSINKETDLFVIQTTFLDRLGLYCDIENEFISLCKRENPERQTEKIEIDFYNHWLKYFYSPNLEVKEFEKQVDLLSAWLRFNGINFIFIGMDELLNDLSEEFFKRNNFIDFDKNKFAFYPIASINKYRIADIIFKTNTSPDFHFNQIGHDYLFNKIIQHIKS
jgi:hypothetical protein